MAIQKVRLTPIAPATYGASPRWKGDKCRECGGEIYLKMLLGYACEQCHTIVKEKKSRLRKPHQPVHGFIYLVKSPTGYYKIGRAKNVNQRTKRFEVNLPFEVELDHVIEADDYTAAESTLHKRFADKRVPNSEWFALTPDDVQWLKSISRL